MHYFSASTNNFYSDKVHAAHQMPADIVGVTDEAFRSFLSQRAQGAVISGNAEGYPVAHLAISVVEIARGKKRIAINGAYEQATAVFKARYPRTEIDGWAEQVRALEAYDANPQAPNVLIDILAQHNGRTRAAMAEDIRAARDRFVFAYAQLTGLRQKLEADLNAISLQAGNAESLIAAIDETQLTVLAQQLQQAGG